MRALLWVLTTLACLFLVAPVLVVLPLAFNDSEFLLFPPPAYSARWFGAFFADASWTGALLRSLAVGAGATAMALLIGVSASYAMWRGRSGLAGMVRPALMLPLIVPSVVFGAGAYLLLTRLELLSSLLPLTVAHALLATPLVVMLVSAALSTTDSTLELAARSLGASPMRAYGGVTFRLTLPAIVIAGVIAFVISLDEVVVALFLSPDRQPTLPVRMYSSIRYELDPLVPVASTIVIAITFVAGVVCILAFQRIAARNKPQGSPHE